MAKNAMQDSTNPVRSGCTEGHVSGSALRYDLREMGIRPERDPGRKNDVAARQSFSTESHQHVPNWEIHRRLRKENTSVVLSASGWPRIECV
jgi:hypothetical protein